MKKISYIFLSLLLILLALYIILPKYVSRSIYWNFVDLNDHEKFDNLDINKGEEAFHFFNVKQDFSLEIPEPFSELSEFNDFDNFLEENKCVAFLIIRNDTLLYENYFDNYDEASIIPSFSVAKAFISALVGIAIDEGYIYSPDQSITFFLKELESPEFNNITIEDLLNMRSGINFQEKYTSPYSDMPKYYYGTDLKEYIKTLEIKSPPNITYDYISINTFLLSQIVERATNTKLNIYAEKKLWKPLGMEFDASWSVDSEKNQAVKAYCCLNARARDFAKFGRLYLHKGNWNGEQIVPENWVSSSTSIINDSRDFQGYPYTYHWRVLENGAFFAKGVLGQYIFVYPEKKLIFVRMGKDYADIDWADFFMESSKQL